MTSSLGRFGESYAVGYLTRRGLRILDRNVRYRVGEIDIVALDGQTYVFVEVKCRRTSTFGSPEESITARRYQHIVLAGQSYLQSIGSPDAACRIDLVAIEVDASGRVTRCHLFSGLEMPP